MRLIGVDPGLRNTGWGIIDFIENKITWIASGTISPKTNVTLPERLRTIHEEVSKILPLIRGLQVINLKYELQVPVLLQCLRLNLQRNYPKI